MLTVTTLPTGYPVSLSEAKAQLRVGDDEDTLIAGYIAAATGYAEERLGRSLLTQGVTLTLPRFPVCRAHPVELPRGPVQTGETVTISYTDSEGDAATLASFQIAPTFAGANVFPAVGEYWPSVQCGKADAVTVTYTAGYGETADVPHPIRQAILLLVSDMYERRTDTVIGATVAKVGVVEMLLSPYRVLRGV